MTELFEALLAEESIPYHNLPCELASIEKRVDFAVARLI